jgi:hypothetical protein
MISDVKLNEDNVVIEGKLVHCNVEGLKIRNPNVADNNQIALAHTNNDELVLNQGGNYKGGIKSESDFVVAGKVTSNGPFPPGVVGVVKDYRNIVTITCDNLFFRTQESSIVTNFSWVDNADPLDLIAKIKELEKKTNEVDNEFSVAGKVTSNGPFPPGVVGVAKDYRNIVTITCDNLFFRTQESSIVTNFSWVDNADPLDLIAKIKELEKRIVDLEKRMPS